MANIDIRRRRVILDEWIAELRLARGVIEHDCIEKTDLAPLRRQLLADLNVIIDYVDSRFSSSDTGPSEAPAERLH